MCERIKDLLPKRAGYAGVIAKDNRLFVEAVLYTDDAGNEYAMIDFTNVRAYQHSALWEGEAGIRSNWSQQR